MRRVRTGFKVVSPNCVGQDFRVETRWTVEEDRDPKYQDGIASGNLSGNMKTEILKLLDSGDTATARNALPATTRLERTIAALRTALEFENDLPFSALRQLFLREIAKQLGCDSENRKRCHSGLKL